MKLRRLKKKLHKDALVFSGLLILAVALGVGCSDAPKAPPASAPPPQTAKQPIASAPPKAAVSQAEEAEPLYVYNPAGRRDPFMPLIVRDEKKAKAADRPPLERYTITEFKLTGIVWGGFGYNAMLEGPDGKGYFVRVGTVIGQNRGVIRKITKSNMVIEEKFKDAAGDMQRNEIIVELRLKQEGAP